MSGLANGLRLLSLDGGGIRGLSELIVLREIMRRIQHDEGLSSVPRPCEYFDLIGGTSTGGLIAIMLGRLRLTVDQAIDQYSQFAGHVFSKKKRKGKDGTFKASKLEEAIKKVVESYGVEKSPNERMMDPRPANTVCKTFVCAMPALHISSPRIFRTYMVREHRSHDCMIWQAARATSAAPTFFKRIRIGEQGSEEEFLDGGLGCNNPIKQVLEESEAAFGPDACIACIVSIGTGQGDVIGLRSPDAFQRALPLNLIAVLKEIATTCESAAEDTEKRFKRVNNVYFRFNVEQGMQGITLAEWKKLGEVTQHTMQYIQKSAVNQKINAAVEAIRGRQALIRTAELNGPFGLALSSAAIAFQDRATLQTRLTFTHIFDNVESLAMDSDLNNMPYANGARFDADKGCLPGTRETIIAEIIQWVNSPNKNTVPRIFFLSGVAGYGKSAIAHAVAQQFEQLGRLGSSYCFDRADRVNRHPSNLLSTIARDIATIDHQWKAALFNVIKGNPSLQTTRSAIEQLNKFILEPAKALTTAGSILIVIDALDESAEEPSRKAVVDILAKRTSDLPPNFRILITARPEPDIIDAFNDNQHIFCKYVDTIDDASNEADIALFIESQLSGVHNLELEWPNKQWCRMLVQSSGGLFQWASTACRAIKDGRGGYRPTERLSRFVASARGLDALYLEVLRQAFNADDPTAMSRFKLVMGRILATEEPLSISAHSEGRGKHDPADLMELIVPLLGTLLSGVNQQHVPVRLLHASFFDFLTDKNRSKSYHVDLSQHN